MYEDKVLNMVLCIKYGVLRTKVILRLKVFMNLNYFGAKQYNKKAICFLNFLIYFFIILIFVIIWMSGTNYIHKYYMF